MKYIVDKKLEDIYHHVSRENDRQNAFLTGRLGMVLYYFNLYIVREEDHYRSNGEQLLEKIFDELNSADPRLRGTSLCSGGAGLGYVVNQLAAAGVLQFNVEQEFQELDKYLFNTSLVQLAEDEIDFLHGALGVIHYFAERKQTPVINTYLNTLVAALCRRAVSNGEGIWFRNNAVRLKTSDTINLSLSHGLCGVLLVLLAAYPNCTCQEQVKAVIDRGIHFILKHQLPTDYEKKSYSVFPFSFDRKDTELAASNRMGWCYGDLGQVLLLYRAGHLFGNPQYLEIADLIGTQTTLRTSTQATMINEAHFCHGASGVAQLYKAIHQASGNEVYLRAWQYWIEKTVVFYDNDIKLGTYEGREQSLLEGLLGVGFTLLSYISPKDLTWSRALLL